MDLFALIVLLLLAAPVIGIVALIRSITDRNLLRQLDARVKALEPTQVVARAAAPAAAQPAPPPAPTVVAPAEPSPPPEPPARTPTAVPLSPPAPPSPPKIGFEEKFGTRWVVWVGGVALALGGIFLVRYTIQQGLIGPGVRIFLGALLALALVAAGEWSRRTEKLSALAGVPSAHIPGTLTAAGTTVAYATVYAAYGLYGFLPPAAAFILLGAVALLDFGRRVAAWTRARRPGRDRRLSGADAGCVHRAGFLVALYLHRRRQCGRFRAGAVSHVALARHRGGRAGRAVDAAGNAARCRHGAGCACLPRARRLRAGRHVFGLRLDLWPAGRARHDRPPLDLGARGLSVGRGVPGAGEPA